jgi:hypothetical protein
MKKIAVIAGIALLIILAAQCKKKQDVAADKAAVEHIVVNDKTWFNSSTTTDSTNDTTYVQLTPDTVLFWWRGTQTHDTAVLDVQVVGDSAYVGWSRHNAGDLNLLIKVPDTSWQLWVKKVVETARVSGIFTRTGASDDSNRGWSLKRISLATGASDSVNTVRIDSLRIQSETNPNLLIVDPLHKYFRLDSLTRFTSGELVSLTLYTNATDGNAFLHTFIFTFPWYIRVQFAHQGNGVYTGAWHAQIIEFPRFCIFDVMDHRTLFTPTYGYDFAGWLFPYRILNQD